MFRGPPMQGARLVAYLRGDLLSRREGIRPGRSVYYLGRIFVRFNGSAISGRPAARGGGETREEPLKPHSRSPSFFGRRIQCRPGPSSPYIFRINQPAPPAFLAFRRDERRIVALLEVGMGRPARTATQSGRTGRPLLSAITPNLARPMWTYLIRRDNDSAHAPTRRPPF